MHLAQKVNVEELQGYLHLPCAGVLVWYLISIYVVFQELHFNIYRLSTVHLAFLSSSLEKIYQFVYPSTIVIFIPKKI